MLYKAATHSPSQYRIGCLAISHKGEVLGITHNGYRRENVSGPRKNTGQHAEKNAIYKWGSKIKSLVIMRIGNGGDIRPIHPCEHCLKLARKLGIEIITINEKPEGN